MGAPETQPPPLPLVVAANTVNNTADLPHLRKNQHGVTQLIVHGKPFLMLASELHNSSLSSARYMDSVLPELKAQSINTLLGSVTWEAIEPEEGRFDFSELNRVITSVRTHGMHLVLLWFGSYKNGISTYVPGWVKKDVKRFPRVHITNPEEGNNTKTKTKTKTKTIEMLSPFSKEAVAADARAFAALMSHLSAIDGPDTSTVLMVQVENETGLLGDSRDRSAAAERAFSEPVPPALLSYLAREKEAGRVHPKFTAQLPSSIDTDTVSSNHSWADIFGPDSTAADEAFMAFHISRYVARVAASGRAKHPIPLYTNTWLNVTGLEALEPDLRSQLPPAVVGGGIRPGVYPSGGPCPHVLDIWRFHTNTGSALDFLAPDLYFHNYKTVCDDYSSMSLPDSHPLFIPEQRRDSYGARRVWLALASYSALGTAPFGIDTGPEEVGREYRLLAQTQQYLLDAAPADRFGFFFDDDVDTESDKVRWTRVFGDIEVVVERSFVFGRPGPGAGMVIHLGKSRFLLVGRGFHARFRSTRPEATFAGILRATEKEYDPATQTLRTLRLLNGDETRSGEFVMMPNDDPDYGGFPIAVTIPARTCIAEVEAYWVAEKDD